MIKSESKDVCNVTKNSNDLLIAKILVSTTVFNIDNNKKLF